MNIRFNGFAKRPADALMKKGLRPISLVEDGPVEGPVDALMKKGDIFQELRNCGRR